MKCWLSELEMELHVLDDTMCIFQCICDPYHQEMSGVLVSI